MAQTQLRLTTQVQGILPVPNGGSGVASTTAYAPLFGGTTSTAPFQSGTVGTAGQVLTSNGAGSLPTFQASASVFNSWKDSVRVATAAAGTLASDFENGDTVDGITLATNDRILIKDQAAPAENGIYTVNASGAPTRSTDMDVWTEVPNATVAVQVGTAGADTIWICTSNAGGTLNTTAITFTEVPTSPILAGTGLTKTGSTINANATDTSITMNADDFAVNNNTTGGLETSTGVRIKLDSTTDGYATISTGANGARVVSVKNANVATDAAIAFSKLATLASANILVGNGSGVATSVAMSGDVTISNAGVTTVDAAFVKNADIVTREVPSGAINGANTSFSLANTPVAGTETLYLNGLEQNVGGAADYTISGATITYNTAPTTGDILVVSYFK